MASIYLAAPDGSQTVHEESSARELWSRGLVGADWLYWREGMAEWRPATEWFGVAPPPAGIPVPPVAIGVPPLATAVPPAAYSFGAPRGFVKDPTRLTRLLVILLWVGVGSAVVGMILEGISMATGYAAGSADGELRALDLVTMIVALLYMPMFIVTGVTFLMWIYRANKNARGFGARDLEYTPGWSVGWYFVPLLNLWKPYQAMKQIWQASMNPNAWRAEEPPPLLGAWWGMWIFNGILGNISFRMGLSADTPGLMSASSIVNLISGATEIALCLLAIRVVKSIFELQNGWASQPMESRCAVCDRPMAAEEMVLLNNVYVCSGCKPTMLQQIAEGASFR